MKKHGAITYDIWVPQVELSGSAELFKRQSLRDATVKARITTCYDILTEPGDQDESILLLPFRKMLWRTVKKLNAVDWKSILQPTDDFAVIASDESGFQVEDDAKNSLPDKKRKLLEARGYFFNEKTDDERETEQKQKYGDLEAQLANKSPKSQIAYLIQQLKLIGNGQSNPAAEDWVILQRLQSIGDAAVLPLLDLAQALGELPDKKGKQPTAAAVLLPRLLDYVARIGRKDLAVERRLRGLMEESVEANETRKKWNRMPFLCAQALQSLFGYPWAVQGWERDELCDVDKYLKVPFKSKK